MDNVLLTQLCVFHFLSTKDLSPIVSPSISFLMYHGCDKSDGLTDIKVLSAWVNNLRNIPSEVVNNNLFKGIWVAHEHTRSFTHNTIISNKKGSVLYGMLNWQN